MIRIKITPTLQARIGKAERSLSAGTDRRISRMLILMMVTCSSLAGGAERDDQDPTIRKLVRPINSIVDGKPFRQAIVSIADQAQLNVWIDRRVDPSPPVLLGPIGPTTYSALDQLAQSQNCVVMPVRNVVLIGRPKWVDQAAASVMLLQIDDRSQVANIAWGDLTTPAEALAIAADQPLEIDPILPHDLWPAADLQSLDRRIAIALILAQFDRRPISTDSISKLKTEPADMTGQLGFPYQLGAMSDDFRTEFLATDRRGRVELKAESVFAQGSVAAHRQALNAVLAMAKSQSADPDRSVFTIKKMRTTAANALIQLAKMAGRSCHIDSQAEQACQKIVSVDGKDLTLRELTDRIAAEVGVLATWNADTIVITLPVVHRE